MAIYNIDYINESLILNESFKDNKIIALIIKAKNAFIKFFRDLLRKIINFVRSKKLKNAARFDSDNKSNENNSKSNPYLKPHGKSYDDRAEEFWSSQPTTVTIQIKSKYHELNINKIKDDIDSKMAFHKSTYFDDNGVDYLNSLINNISDGKYDHSSSYGYNINGEKDFANCDRYFQTTFKDISDNTIKMIDEIGKMFNKKFDEIINNIKEIDKKDQNKNFHNIEKTDVYNIVLKMMNQIVPQLLTAMEKRFYLLYDKMINEYTEAFQNARKEYDEENGN